MFDGEHGLGRLRYCDEASSQQAETDSTPPHVCRDEAWEYNDPELVMVMDSKGLHDSLDNDLPGDDRKSAMEVPIIEEFLRLTVGRARWTPHDKNPADALTKFKGAHLEPLISLIKQGMYRLSPEQESLDERRQEKEAKGYNSRRKTSARTLGTLASGAFSCMHGVYRAIEDSRAGSRGAL